MSGVSALTASNFNEKTTESRVCVVDFWASWCGPCMMLAPVIDELAADFSGRAEVYKVNVDEESSLAAKFGIMSIPTVIVFRDGEVFEKSLGVVPKEHLAGIIENALK